MQETIKEGNKLVKWKMISWYKFTGEAEGYIIDVSKSSWWVWSICKDGEMIDNCFRHSPTYSELAAKVQAERVLNEIINNQNKQQ